MEKRVTLPENVHSPEVVGVGVGVTEHVGIVVKRVTLPENVPILRVEVIYLVLSKYSSHAHQSW